jgi:hypothetical protein
MIQTCTSVPERTSFITVLITVTINSASGTNTCLRSPFMIVSASKALRPIRLSDIARRRQAANHLRSAGYTWLSNLVVTRDFPPHHHLPSCKDLTDAKDFHLEERTRSCQQDRSLDWHHRQNSLEP